MRWDETKKHWFEKNDQANKAQNSRWLSRACERGQTSCVTKSSQRNQIRRAESRRMHQLSAAGISPEWKIPCRLWGRCESLCVLSGLGNQGSQERAQGLWHEQGHTPVSSGEAVAGHTGAKISEAADGGENVTKNPTKLEILRLRCASSNMTKDAV